MIEVIVRSRKLRDTTPKEYFISFIIIMKYSNNGSNLLCRVHFLGLFTCIIRELSIIDNNRDSISL